MTSKARRCAARGASIGTRYRADNVAVRLQTPIVFTQHVVMLWLAQCADVDAGSV